MHHNYIAIIIPTANSYHRRKNALIILQNRVNHNFFKNSFFLSTIKEGNVYDYDINNSDNFAFFTSKLLTFIRLCANSVFNSHNPK